MRRPLAALFAVAATVIAPTADACSCIGYRTQAEADAAGEAAYRRADLIVDATVGDTSWVHRTVCRGKALPPSVIGFGQSISADRPITVHRVLKGQAQRRPILIGDATKVSAEGCVISNSSCDIPIPSRRRITLVLQRVDGERYRPLSLCDIMAIRNSKAGQALFKRAG